MGPMVPIERVEAPTREAFLQRWVRPSRPVVIRGALDGWRATRAWSIAHLRERFGDRVVPAARRKGAYGFFDPERGVHYEEVRLAEYLDAIEGGGTSDLYVAFPVREHLPELLDDIERPPYCKDARWFRARFWCAGEGTRSVLHRDLPENLYAQIVGRKRFVLVNRREHARVYPFSIFTKVPNYARVDAEEPDLAAFPRFTGVERLVCDLEPGDLFYIPSLWWHQARSLTPSAAINLWWADGALHAVIKAAETFMRVRELRL